MAHIAKKYFSGVDEDMFAMPDASLANLSLSSVDIRLNLSANVSRVTVAYVYALPVFAKVFDKRKRPHKIKWRKCLLFTSEKG